MAFAVVEVDLFVDAPVASACYYFAVALIFFQIVGVVGSLADDAPA